MHLPTQPVTTPDLIISYLCYQPKVRRDTHCCLTFHNALFILLWTTTGWGTGKKPQAVRMESNDTLGNSDDDSYVTDAEEAEWEHIEPHLSQGASQAQISGLGIALQQAEADETQLDSGTGADVAGLLEVRHLLLRACNVPQGHATSLNFSVLQDLHGLWSLLQDKPRYVIERALAANRRLQSRLVDILAAVDRAILRNAETQAKLMHNAEAWPRVGRYRGMRGT